MRSLAALIFLAACSTTTAEPGAAPQLQIEPYEFASRGGQRVAAERGRFEVPVNRNDPNSARIELRFVRFPSTSPNPGNPIVYLSGGPGAAGTGTAQGPRFDIFMALRAQADVIAFDQRGTGMSHAPPNCAVSQPIDTAQPLTRANIVAHVRADTARCLAWWRDQGVDIGAYNTRENAADIDDLRRALGAERIALWAISYGTHLGAAYLREYDEHVGRAVFAGYEGPDDTVKMPSGTDAMLARFAAVVAANPEAAQAYPDPIGTMRRVLARLEREPATVTIQHNNQPLTLTFGAFPVQMLTGGVIADPNSAVQLLPLYAEMDAGRFERVATVMAREFLRNEMRAMPTAMDMASGITQERLRRVGDEARTALLGDALNFPMPHLLGVAPELDLGDAFRAPLSSATPILFISGTLDGRTYPEAAQAALATLPNSRQMIVENGGHNIYEADPRMQQIVLDWFARGVAPERIALAPPQPPAPR